MFRYIYIVLREFQSCTSFKLYYVVSILFLIKSISSCYYFGLLALCVVSVDSDVDVFRR